jgi:large subunit ribosomal protein L17
MLANMTNDLIVEGRIKTTTPKAKVLRSYVEKMITLGKAGTVASRRRAMAFMRSKSAVTKLFTEVAPRYTERPGGYTRIMKNGFRDGDCAPMAIIELVEDKVKKAKKKPAKKVAVKKAATDAKPKAAAKPKAEIEVKPKAEIEAKPKAEIEVKPKAEPKAEAKPKTEAEAKPKTETKE